MLYCLNNLNAGATGSAFENMFFFHCYSGQKNDNLWYNCLSSGVIVIILAVLWFYPVFFFFLTLQGPVMCVYFRNVRMSPASSSVFVRLAAVLTRKRHQCEAKKTSKGLFNVCWRSLCQSSVSEWGATRHRRLCTLCPLTHTSSGCVLNLKSTAATAVQPLSVCSPF